MIDVKQTLSDAGESMEMATMYLNDELQRIRAGRANVAILDGVRVDSYGSKVPLNQVASVMVPDARTIAIKPWDKKAIKDIEKAIMDSDVGITPENNGELIRLNLPQPTEERRKDLVKQCNKIGERTKVQIRNVRSDIKEKLKKLLKMACLKIMKRMQKTVCRSFTTNTSSRLMHCLMRSRRRL